MNHYPKKAEVKRGVKFRAELDGSSHYFTNRRCVNGHLSFRYTSNGCCVECKERQNKSRYH